MYAALWRVLPGPWWLRTLILVFAGSLVLIACVMFLFPWADQTYFAPQDPTVESGTVDDGSVSEGDGGVVAAPTDTLAPEESSGDGGGSQGDDSADSGDQGGGSDGAPPREGRDDTSSGGGLAG